MRILRLAGRAMRLHCPNCGSGAVVRVWARVADSCPRCRHRFEREEGYWLGAVMMNTVVSIGVFAALFVTLMVLTWPEVPWATVSVVTIAVNLVFPVLFHPWARMLWVALDLSVRPAADHPGGV